MKKSLLFISLYCLASGSIIAQVTIATRYEYTVLYDYTFQPGKDDSTRKVTEMMVLHTGKQSSSFQSLNRYLTDSTLLAEARNAEASGFAPRFSRESMPERPKVTYIVLKQFHENRMNFYGTFIVQRPYYTDTLPRFAARLSEEEKQVLGYTCKKASFSFAGRQYIAWYATDIPVADGPYKFNGLPGLILEIHDTERQHSFVATRLQKQEKTVVSAKWEGRYVQQFDTKAAYTRYTKSLKDNPSGMLALDLMSIPEDKLQVAVEKIKNDIKRNNNSLEIEE